MLFNNKHAGLVAAIRRDVPSGPGVYIFANCHGDTIYVGKSVNLRARMLSYLRTTQPVINDRTNRMVYEIEHFRFHETSTELLALLLEDALIKTERPVYNIRQQEYEACRYVRLSQDRYPTLKIVDREETADQADFGPFKDVYTVARIREAAGRYFGLRTCTDASPYRKCARYEESRSSQSWRRLRG